MSDLWEDLAEKIADEMLNPNKLFPYHRGRKQLVKDIKDVIENFSRERIIQVTHFRGK